MVGRPRVGAGLAQNQYRTGKFADPPTQAKTAEMLAVSERSIHPARARVYSGRPPGRIRNRVRAWSPATAILNASDITSTTAVRLVLRPSCARICCCTLVKASTISDRSSRPFFSTARLKAKTMSSAPSRKCPASSRGCQFRSRPPAVAVGVGS